MKNQTNTTPTEIKLNNKTFYLYKASDYVTIITSETPITTKIPNFVITQLYKGLNYVPHTNYYPLESLEQEFSTFKYKILWQTFFNNAKHRNNNAHTLPPKLTKINQNEPLLRTLH